MWCWRNVVAGEEEEAEAVVSFWKCHYPLQKMTNEPNININLVINLKFIKYYNLASVESEKILEVIIYQLTEI